MRKLIIPISLSCLSLSFIVLPAGQSNKSHKKVAVSLYNTITDSSFTALDVASSIYQDISLEQYGLSKEAFRYAYKGYQKMLEKKMILRADYLTICDFSQSSRQKRLYLVDLINNKLVMNTYVAHGRNSGGEYATQFSNQPESLESSLGFYVTKNTYTGEHGLSLKIEGVEPGYNDKAGQRNIVIHGAAYIDNDWLQHSSYMGRSYGCPAIPQKESTNLINIIKNGTCLFIYHPEKNYLLRSKILND